MAVLLIGTLDTKGLEIGFVRECLQRQGIESMVLDAGVMGPPSIPADIPREMVFEASGKKLASIQEAGDRGDAIEASARGAEAIAMRLYREGKIDGILGLGGSAGTTIATKAMRSLPFGVPKLMVSTLASGQVRPFVGPRDLLMMHSVTDISGINRISSTVLRNAAGAMAGMIQSPPLPREAAEKPVLAATMFGVTTPCVERCRALAESKGYEVLVFHAVGTGGEAMESLIADGLITGVLDVTTTELADELVGGVLSAGPRRLTAASDRGVPQVLSVGALDMVNFGPRATVPTQFEGRQFYVHNENVTLMRTTPEENAKLGAEIAYKASASRGPTAIALPLRGVSAIDAEGKPFWDPHADEALFNAIRANVGRNVRMLELDMHINDPSFALSMVECLMEMLTKQNAK
ncbi:MAG: Tm-1-like ATP-binding domain-containing protein [Planctomycetota bacterium]